MKKGKFNKKLVLNKETISSLNSPEMNNLKGGTDDQQSTTCMTANHCQCAYEVTYWYHLDTCRTDYTV